MNIFKFSKVQRSVGIHLFLTKICIYFICDFRFYCKDLSIRKLSIIWGFSASSFHWLTSRLFFVTFNVVNEYSSSLHFGHKFQSHINHLNKISKKKLKLFTQNGIQKSNWPKTERWPVWCIIFECVDFFSVTRSTSHHVNRVLWILVNRACFSRTIVFLKLGIQNWKWSLKS